MKFRIRTTLFLLVLLPFMSTAGWVITGRYIDRDGKTILKRYFIQDNNIKVEQYNLIYSLNLKTQDITLVDPENLVYTVTTFKEYAEKIKSVKLNRLRILLDDIPPGEREIYNKEYKTQIENEVFLPFYNSDSLSIEKVTDTLKLLGFHTSKYTVSENGNLKEELFYTNDVGFSADMDLKAFMPYVYLLEPEDQTTFYRSSKKYIDLVQKGLVIRRFIIGSDYRAEWQVNKVEQKNIPAYEFYTPSLCKKLTLDGWFARQKNAENTLYDDYE